MGEDGKGDGFLFFSFFFGVGHKRRRIGDETYLPGVSPEPGQVQRIGAAHAAARPTESPT